MIADDWTGMDRVMFVAASHVPVGSRQHMTLLGPGSRMEQAPNNCVNYY